MEQDNWNSFLYGSKVELEAWLATPQGAMAQQAKLGMLRFLMAKWPSRGRSVLIMGAGNSFVAEYVYESGFDTTVQEENPIAFSNLCENKKHFLAYTLGASNQLPFDDASFDYVIMLAGLEFYTDPASVLQEMRRLALSGCIVCFSNLYSLSFGKQILGKKTTIPGKAHAYFKVKRQVECILQHPVTASAAVLPFPEKYWQTAWCKRFSPTLFRFPLGAFVGMTVSFKLVGGTRILLPAQENRQMVSNC